MTTSTNKPSRRFPWARKATFVAGGAALGFAYYYFVGCASGTCPITSNPYIATAYGGLIGLLFGRS